MLIWSGFFAGIAAGIGLNAFLNSLSQRKREARVREAERRAADAERLAELGSLTSGLAHEIKNPLSSVVLNAQLVEEAMRDLEAPEDEKESVVRRSEALVREAERLRTILTDFLQFAGRVRLDREPQDLRNVVEDLVDFFHPQADAAGVVLRADLPSRKTLVAIDAALLKQALLNLMINAVHAMESNPPERPRELLVRLSPSEDSVSVHVIDSGPGVPAEDREKIFHPYVSSTTGGTGLGLPTTRRIVEEHGGRIDLEVLEGRGSDFVVVLPADPPDEESEAVDSPFSLSS
ncbi:MAG: two-component sensor histidine kinase [Planctomycetaceae bacterium]|nr:two-component sensor histidine kinase [Planctomycetaceae bacterium]